MQSRDSRIRDLIELMLKFGFDFLNENLFLMVDF